MSLRRYGSCFLPQNWPSILAIFSMQVNMRCYGDKPPEFMAKVPNGLLPVLEVDGQVRCRRGLWLDGTQRTSAGCRRCRLTAPLAIGNDLSAGHHRERHHPASEQICSLPPASGKSVEGHPASGNDTLALMCDVGWPLFAQGCPRSAPYIALSPRRSLRSCTRSARCCRQRAPPSEHVLQLSCAWSAVSSQPGLDGCARAGEAWDDGQGGQGSQTGMP